MVKNVRCVLSGKKEDKRSRGEEIFLILIFVLSTLAIAEVGCIPKLMSGIMQCPKRIK
jgi:hypothetical protein